MEEVYNKAFEYLQDKDNLESVDKGLAILEEIYQQDPNNIKACFEYAGGWDSIGQEEKAVIYYEKVKVMGIKQLPKNDQPCFYVQYGSTLRNLKQFDQAKVVFEEGVKAFPDFLAIQLFQALNFCSMGIEIEKNKIYLEEQIKQINHPSVERYSRSLKNYLNQLMQN
ncbi:MAG TPA: tetratricopeptide repeat protein [Oligoflexia bacterium]|nr:tetratricopeptide repeat protein [Oligoflexia bacterium]HMR24642.1 tetratricopeptide repeat protein [Oligoflexia bacterium]